MCDFDKQYEAWTPEIGTLVLTYSVAEATRLNLNPKYHGVNHQILILSNPTEDLYYQWDFDQQVFVPQHGGVA